MEYPKVQIRNEIREAIQTWELAHAELHRLAREENWSPEECPLSYSHARGVGELGDDGSHMWRTLSLFGPGFPAQCEFCGTVFE